MHLPACSRLVAAVAVVAASAAAQAAPDPMSEAVLQFLSERSVVEDAAPPGLIERVRSTASDLVLAAMNFLGVPYRRGGTSETEGFDCSGFTRHVFALTLGLVLPRRSDEQALSAGLVDVPQAELAPGDLVFFNTLRHAFSHVGIYVGNGKFIHAPRSGSAVRIEDMRGNYWARRFDGARRAPVAAERNVS